MLWLVVVCYGGLRYVMVGCGMLWCVVVCDGGLWYVMVGCGTV